MPKLNAGIIGTGAIGYYHLMGYESCAKSVKIHALCDINPPRLNEMGDRFNVPAERRYTDYKEMLAKEPIDIASVCVPNAYHFECASATIKQGIPTLIEKPMVLTREDAKELKRLAARKQVKTMIAFSHRFIAGNIEAKKMLDKGAIGEPFMIRVRYAHGGPYPGWAQSDWFYKKAIAGGGAMLDMGIHAIDICQFMIGPIKNVSARVATLRKKIEVDDNAVMMLDFAPRKCLGYIEVGWTSGPGFAGIEIYGDKGSFVLELGNPRWIRGVTKPDGTVETRTDPISSEGPANWMFQIDNWVRHVQGKKTAIKIPSIEEGISSLLVALAAAESNKTGQRISVK